VFLLLLAELLDFELSPSMDRVVCCVSLLQHTDQFGESLSVQAVDEKV